MAVRRPRRPIVSIDCPSPEKAGEVLLRRGPRTRRSPANRGVRRLVQVDNWEPLTVREATRQLKSAGSHMYLVRESLEPAIRTGDR